MLYLTVAAVTAICGLVAGFLLGKRASAWCPRCGGPSAMRGTRGVQVAGSAARRVG